MNKKYQIVRISFHYGKRIIKTGLTLEQAKAHCQNPETSGSTCSDPKKRGQWFHGFEEMPTKTVRDVHKQLRERKLRGLFG